MSGRSSREAEEAMSQDGISTHVLDLALGVPAAGVRVRLEREAPDDYAAAWALCASGVTDKDGRCRPLQEAEKVLAGKHRLTFETAAYLAGLEQPAFFPEVTVTFLGEADGGSCHVPLLLSPFGYSTYRGS